MHLQLAQNTAARLLVKYRKHENITPILEMNFLGGVQGSEAGCGDGGSSHLSRTGDWKSWKWEREAGREHRSRGSGRNQQRRRRFGAGRNQRRHRGFRNTHNHLPKPVDQIHIQDVYKFLNIYSSGQLQFTLSGRSVSGASLQALNRH